MPRLTEADAPAIFLLLIGTLASSAAGRVFYQAALTATQNDNGFVTMFFFGDPRDIRGRFLAVIAMDYGVAFASVARVLRRVAVGHGASASVFGHDDTPKASDTRGIDRSSLRKDGSATKPSLMVSGWAD